MIYRCNKFSHAGQHPKTDEKAATVDPEKVASPSKPKEMCVVATPQKKPNGGDVTMSPAPAAGVTPIKPPTPGQTPIKSPALKKSKVDESSGVVGETIPEDKTLPTGSAVDTDPTLSMKYMADCQEWPEDRKTNLTDLTDQETPKSVAPTPVASEAPSTPRMNSPFYGEIEKLKQQYQARIASIQDLKNKKLVQLTDPAKISYLESWADKEAVDAKCQLDQHTAQVEQKYAQASFNPDDFMAELTRDLGAMKIGDDIHMGIGNLPKPHEASNQNPCICFNITCSCIMPLF